MKKKFKLDLNLSGIEDILIENEIELVEDKDIADKALGIIKEKIAQANEKTVHMLMDSDPVWVDMKPAIECVDGLEDHMILHSGPPIAYEDMTMLHKRGMVSAMLFEGWAKDEEEAVKRLKAGEIKISSALDHNTVGAGTGIITKSVVLNVVEDRHNHTVAATFPAEGPFQGGFCGWGL